MKIELINSVDNPFWVTFTISQNNRQLLRCQAKDLPVVIQTVDCTKPVTLTIEPVKILRWCYPLLLLMGLLLHDLLEPFILQRLTFMPQRTVQLYYLTSSTTEFTLPQIQLLEHICYIRKLDFAWWSLLIGLMLLLFVASTVFLLVRVWYFGLLMLILTGAVVYTFLSKGKRLYQYAKNQPKVD